MVCGDGPVRQLARLSNFLPGNRKLEKSTCVVSALTGTLTKAVTDCENLPTGQHRPPSRLHSNCYLQMEPASSAGPPLRAFVSIYVACCVKIPARCCL
jgi:hypothetical protein